MSRREHVHAALALADAPAGQIHATLAVAAAVEELRREVFSLKYQVRAWRWEWERRRS